MYKQRRLRGGSLPIFIVVGALMAIALLGGLYALQRYSSNLEVPGQEIASNDTKDATTDKQQESKKAEDKKAQEAENKKKSEQEAAKQKALKEKQAQEKTAEDKKAEKNKAEEAKKEANERAKEQKVAQEKKAKEDHTLPETGPADTLMQVTAIGFISFAGVSYYRSRRSL